MRGGWGGGDRKLFVVRVSEARAAALLIGVLVSTGPTLRSPEVSAAETTYQVSNQLQIFYDSKWKESLVDDRLDAAVSNGPYTLGATFLSHSPSNPAVLDPSSYGSQQQGIRKRWFEARTERWGIRVGDVYSTFGRGLALSIFEDQIVAFDNALDGANARATVGPAQFEIIAGTNSFGEARQVLKGAHAGIELPWDLHAGAEGVWSDYLAEPGLPRPHGDRLYGGSLRKRLGAFADLYGEYALRDQKSFQPGIRAPAQGHAAYGNVNLYLGPLQILTEYKDLIRYNLPKIPKEDQTLQTWVNPPTAIRQHATTLLNRASHVANIRFEDERGGLVEGFLTLSERTKLAASYNASESRRVTRSPQFVPPGVYNDTRFPAWEAYGEIEQWFGGTELILRLDESEETVDKGGIPIFFERVTGGASVILPLTQVWSVDVTGEAQRTQEAPRARIPEAFTKEEYTTSFVTLTLSRAPAMAWAVSTEWSNDEREPRDFWLWAEWNVRIADRHQLGIAGGRLRGGQVCSGGVCRVVDPFEGGRIELLTTF